MSQPQTASGHRTAYPPRRRRCPGPAGRPGSVLLVTVLLGLGACGPAANGEDRTGGSDLADGAPGSAQAAQATPGRGEAWVVFGADTVVAEVARTAEERADGLMFREDVPPGTGMLFVFDDVQVRSFWMKNTYVPLSIAFMDENHRVVDIADMEPEDEEFTRSSRPALFALEVRQGWFAEKGIQVGAQAEIVFGPG